MRAAKANTEQQGLIDALSDPALLVDAEGILRGANVPARLVMPYLIFGEPAALHLPAQWGKREIPLRSNAIWVIKPPAKHASVEVQDLGETWLALFENEAVAMMLTGEDNLIVHANTAFLKWSGYSLEELIGIPGLRCVHPDDVEETIRRMKGRLRGVEISAVNDYRGVNRAGEVFDIRVGTMEVPGTEYMVYTVLNIQPELKVAQLNERYATLLEACGVGITVLARDKSVVYANPRLLEMLGFSGHEDEFKEKAAGFGLLTPEGRRLALKHTKYREDNHPDYQNLKEVEVIRRDGSIFPVLSMATEVPDSDQLIVSFLDISKLKEAERELGARLAHEELLSKVTSQFLNLRLEDLEPRMQEALACIRLQYDVSRLSLHVHVDGVDEISCFASATKDAPPSLITCVRQSSLWNALEDDATSILLRPDLPPPPGLEALKERMMDVGISFFYAMPYDSGSHRFLLVLESLEESSWSDVEYSNLDTLCMLMANVIERIDAERGRTRMERELWESHKLESVGVLAGGIAHDFNNMLAAILGNAELARADHDDVDFVKQCLDDLIRAGGQAKELVAQILAFARQTEVEALPVSLRQVCENALPLLRASIPRTVDLKANLVAMDEVVTGNFTRLLQVVMNLCTNAYQAIEKDTAGKIRISLINVDEPGLAPEESLCQLIVEDTGPGIPEELIARIFDPFFTTKAPGKGTGMGLSVVHGIVKSHGGTIQAENREEGGARFVVTFRASRRNQVSTTVATDEVMSGNGETILIIDDDPGVLKLMRMMLSGLNYTIESTSDPEEAVSFFAEHSGRLDLVITDLTMPRMTGNDVAREIKKLRPEMTVIACSGYSRSGVDTHVIDGFIAKPLQRAELSQQLRLALDATDK